MNTEGKMYQPKTGEKCSCKSGIQRDNCPACEGTGWRIDFTAIRAKRKSEEQNEYDRDLALRIRNGQVGSGMKFRG